VDSASNFYALHVSTTFSGDAGNPLRGDPEYGNHDGMMFSAKIYDAVTATDNDDDDDDVLRKRCRP